MTDGEIIAALARENISFELLDVVSKRLARKASKEIAPTNAEIDTFERLWKERAKYAKRPGDPKKPALLKYCRQMREKPASFEEIAFGIRCEYSPKKERAELYAQMGTFMGQRRWETYDYAGYQASVARRQSIEASANVTRLRPQEPKIDNEARRIHAEEVMRRAGLRAAGE